MITGKSKLAESTLDFSGVRVLPASPQGVICQLRPWIRSNISRKARARNSISRCKKMIFHLPRSIPPVHSREFHYLGIFHVISENQM